MKKKGSEIQSQRIDKSDNRHGKNGIFARLYSLLFNNPIKFGIYAGLSILILVVTISIALEYAYKPQTCIICHEMKPAHDSWSVSRHGQMKGGADDCLYCHVAPGFGRKIMAKLGGMAFLWDHVIGNYEGDIKAELPVYCVRSDCHTNPWDMDRGSRVRVNHALHISKGYGCVVCHDRIAHGSDPLGMNLPGMKDFCFPCHNDEIASRTNCHFCHVYQAEMLNGTGGDGIPDGSISAHQIEGMDCIDCHTEGCNPQPIQVCNECHQEVILKDFTSQKIWVQESLKTLEVGITTLKEAITESEKTGQEISQLNGIYNLVIAVYNFVSSDYSKGAHNTEYTQLLIDNAVNKLNFAYLLIERNRRKKL